MDQLSMDAKRCMEDGYGPHYGLWKAQHPNTRAENEILIANYEQEQARAAEERKRRARIKTCPVCGKEFFPSKWYRVCCGDECRKKYCWLQQSVKSREHRIIRARCQFCGKEFEHAGRSTRKYCSTTCAYRAGDKRKKEARAILRALDANKDLLEV